MKTIRSSKEMARGGREGRQDVGSTENRDDISKVTKNSRLTARWFHSQNIGDVPSFLVDVCKKNNKKTWEGRGLAEKVVVMVTGVLL